MASACAIALVLTSAVRVRAQPVEGGGEAAANPEVAASTAKKLQNPIENLTSVLLENDLTFGNGPNHDLGYALNLQPILPLPLGPHARLFSSTIVPVIDRPELVAGTSSAFGLGDTTQSFFVAGVSNSPLLWGVGAIFQLPTATDDLLGQGQWCIGPTFDLVLQTQTWTLVLLVEHLVSVVGQAGRRDVLSTYVEPTVSYTRGDFSFQVGTEDTYDWKARQWNALLVVGPSQVVHFGNWPVSFGLQGLYSIAAPANAAPWGIRVPITFVPPDS